MTCEDDLRTAPSMHQQQDTPTPSSIPKPGAGKRSRLPPTERHAALSGDVSSSSVVSDSWDDALYSEEVFSAKLNA